MRVKSFKIKNYRSIKDSGICYLSGDNITILAGKNESGKTAILEALEDFNPDRNIRKEAIPLQNQEAIPEIAVTFEMNKEELVEMFRGLDLEAFPHGKISISIIKKYPNKYEYSIGTKKLLKIKDSQILVKQKEIEDIHASIKKLLPKYPSFAQSLPEIDFSHSEDFIEQMINYVTVARPTLPNIPDPQERNNFSAKLGTLLDKIQEIKNLILLDQNQWEPIISEIPNFILYNSFEDIFPSETPLSEALDNELIQDLTLISDLDLDLIKSGPMPSKMRHKEQLNVSLKKDYERFWKQDLANLSIDWDSSNLFFYIKEDDYFYPPNMRSKGKQWHLAFYIRVSARSKEDVPNIILIDEPGLFLHAKAQEDILNKLDDASKNTQIIFSTHSPYLIKIDKLDRIRLITQTIKKGTLISNKIHKDADMDTLTPIITAIGLDLSIGLDIAKDNNVIFEGITDYYYLIGFKEFLEFEFKKEIHFIPGVGADKSSIFIPLMIAWGFNYCVVLDNDQKGRQVTNKLLKNYGKTNIKIVFTSENKDEEIEDLFEREDFIKYVLNEDPREIPGGMPNSQVFKQRGRTYDKVVLCKLFVEKLKSGDISLSDITKNNFKELLEKLDKSMFPT